MKANRSGNCIVASWLTPLVLLVCLLVPVSPALGQATLHDLAQERIEQVRARFENLTPEQIAQLRASRGQDSMRQKSTAGIGLKAIGEFACLPTCDPNDAKFLAIAGTGLVTLSDPVLDLSLSAPAGTTTFTVGVFDGDGGLPDPTSIDNVGGGNLSRWDLTGAFGFTPQDVDYSYKLYASPPGGPEVQIDLTPGTGDACPLNCEFQGADMLNDDWLDLTIVTGGPGGPAETPSGNFLYRFEIAQDLADPHLPAHVNVFKVRTNAVVTLRLANQPVSYISVVNVSEDFFDVFPLDGAFYNAEPTTYDGTWSFFFDVAADQEQLIVWDGDFDHGDSIDFGFTNQDTDDPDTPNDPFLPTTAGLFDSTSDACFETVSQNNPGEVCGTGGAPSGSPADDITLPPVFDPSNTTIWLAAGEVEVRSPSVRTDVIFPDGRSFGNDDPSGNQEWEQFLVSQAAVCDPAPTCVPTDGNPTGLDPEDPVGQPCADVCLPASPGQVPGGVYEIRVQGVDMFNLNALRLPQILCVNEAGTPCVPLRDYLLGDRVFLDLDGDGTDDGGTDPGRPGVVVELLNDSGTVSETTITDAAGNYTFAVDEGSYTLRVADANFAPPAVGGAVGDLVWRDDDGSGAQDSGEPGIANVKVNLFQEVGVDDIFIATTVTDENGAYAFTDLPPGTYFTDVADITVPAGLTLISGPDPSASVTIVTTEVFDTLDFGYQLTTAPDEAIVGDLVWLDEDGDGELDPGERGIGGVTLALIGSDLPLDVFGFPLVLATTQTNDDGSYLFTGVRTDFVPATDYQVQVTDDFGVLSGFTLTVGPDSNPNPTVAFPVVSGDVILTKDFGYDTAALASISDVVWFDTDRDGVLDGGESGIDGVTVALIGPTGGVMDVTTTAGGGLFSFPGLPDGDYSLRITDLDGTLDGLLPTTLASVAGLQAVTLAGVDAGGVNFGWVDTGALADLVGTTLKDPVGDVNQQLDVVPIGDPAGNNLDYDFGYQQVAVNGSIGDRVWNDVDGDGVQDGGEAGINDVTVRLFDSGGGLAGTTMTSGDGDYLFPDLAPGTYTVVVDDSTLPEGFVQTFDIEGPLDHAAEVVLGNGENREDVDFGYADECLPEIDFETDGAGTALVKGQRIDDEWAAFGVTVTTDTTYQAMIFDSSAPSGGDWDLGTPNETFSGPGIGSGGEAGQDGENAVALGKVLIISEDDDSDDPDDNASPGTIIFDFAYPVRVDEVGILDIDEGMAGTVTARDAGGSVIGAVGMANSLGNNSVQTVDLGVSGVRSLEIHFPGSGALSGIVFCAADCSPVRVRDDFEVKSFSNSDGPDDWSGDWIENDPQSGGAGPLAGQVQVHDGFLTLDDYPNTGGEPSAAREVDLSGAASASLSFTFATSSGVDTDDAVTVEISNDGGATWSTLEVLTGIYGAVQEDRSYDISTSISSETQVRFRVSNKYGGSAELFCVLFLEIKTDCDDCQSVAVRDNFEVASFSNNNGPDDWSGDWIEDDPQSGGAGPLSGQVVVKSGYLRLDDYPNTGGEPSLAREVDLSGAASATLRFDFDTSSGVDKDDAVTVEISADGGANWTTLEVITEIYGATWQERSFDITSFISAQTQVRFRVSNKYGGAGETFFVNYVEIVTPDCGFTPTAPVELK